MRILTTNNTDSQNVILCLSPKYLCITFALEKNSALHVSIYYSKNALERVDGKLEVAVWSTKELPEKISMRCFPARSFFFLVVRHIRMDTFYRHTDWFIFINRTPRSVRAAQCESRSINAAKNSSPLSGEGAKEREWV